MFGERIGCNGIALFVSYVTVIRYTRLDEIVEGAVNIGFGCDNDIEVIGDNGD
jgi:hypothetical protein